MSGNSKCARVKPSLSAHYSNLINKLRLHQFLGTKGGGMYLIFPVIVLVIVLLQCLSCSFEQNQKVDIADMHYDYDYDNDKKQDTKSVFKTTETNKSLKTDANKAY